MVIELIIPTPETLIAITFFGMGIVFGRGFGKRLDQDIQASEWFMKQPELNKWIFKRLLDVTHHWWIGMLMVLYLPYEECIWFGWGLVVDDIPDLPFRYSGLERKEPPDES
jgi:hypothetical protein